MTKSEAYERLKELYAAGEGEMFSRVADTEFPLEPYNAYWEAVGWLSCDMAYLMYRDDRVSVQVNVLYCYYGESFDVAGYQVGEELFGKYMDMVLCVARIAAEREAGG